MTYVSFEGKVSKSQKQFMVSPILPKNEQISPTQASSLPKKVNFVRFMEELRIP